MNILYIHDNEGGVKYHRQDIPHKHLEKYGFKCTSLQSSVKLTEEILKNFQLVQFQRQVSLTEDIQDKINLLNKLDIISVLDLDDFWELPKHSYSLGQYKLGRITERIKESIKAVDLVTTASKQLTWEVSQLTNKVEHIPNAVDPEAYQFKSEHKPSDLVRFGWIGGVSHLRDIELLREGIINLDKDKELKNKWQIVLGGFDMNETFVEIDSMGRRSRINVPKEKLTYPKMEMVLTNNYRTLFNYPHYINELKKYERTEDSDVMAYKRIWTRNIHDYATMYDEIDISLIPLENNRFNHCKSVLKIIEAGFKKKPVICSNVLPYSDYLTNKNSILISNNSGWHASIRRLMNKDEREELANNLYETVQEFHIDKVTKQRAEIYKQIK